MTEKIDEKKPFKREKYLKNPTKDTEVLKEKEKETVEEKKPVRRERIIKKTVKDGGKLKDKEKESSEEKKSKAQKTAEDLSKKPKPFYDIFVTKRHKRK